MPDEEVQVTTMGCAMCDGQFVVNDLRSLGGEVVCKHCFVKAKEGGEDPGAKRDKPKLRFKGDEFSDAQVWTNPNGEFTICGLAQEKSIFFAATLPEEQLREAEDLLKKGADVEEVLGEECSIVPVGLIAGAEASMSGSDLQLFIQADGDSHVVSVVLMNPTHKNQFFVELAGALGDKFSSQSDVKPDFGQMAKFPIVAAVLGIVVAVGLVMNAGKIEALTAGAAAAIGAVIAIIGLAWAGWAIYSTPKVATNMALRPVAPPAG